MWAYIGCSSHSHSINMFAHLCPTHFLRCLWEFQLQKIKEEIKFGKEIFDNMHKPRLSLNLNKIIQKEKKLKKESFTKFALSLTFHFSDTFFLYF